MKLNKDQFTVIKNNKEYTLSPNEWKLVEYLYDRKGKVISQDELLIDIWGGGAETAVVRVYVGYVRKKLGKDSIRTRRGFGYFIN